MPRVTRGRCLDGSSALMGLVFLLASLSRTRRWGLPGVDPAEQLACGPYNNVKLLVYDATCVRGGGGDGGGSAIAPASEAPSPAEPSPGADAASSSFGAVPTSTAQQ